LAHDGSIVLQAITIEEDLFQSYRLAPDFIQRRIFPGGMLPTRTAIAEQARSAGLQLVSTERFGASYALTLNEWRRRFAEAWPDIEALGFDERFRKLWTYYLSYCEAGFRSGAIDVGFFVLRRRGEGDR
jgi:cyclopropane-fatty-acyl-phospholipid synthase